MAITILGVDERVVIDKILVSSVIRRVDINHVNLALMRIAESSEGFEVVAFDKYMVRCIGRVGEDGSALHFLKHRKMVAKTLLDILGLILPYKTIFLLFVEQFEQCRLLFVSQSFESLYLVFQSRFVHLRVLSLFIMA